MLKNSRLKLLMILRRLIIRLKKSFGKKKFRYN